LVEYNRNSYDLNPAITVKEVYEKLTDGYFPTLKTDGSVHAVKKVWSYCSAIYDMRVMDIRACHVKGCMDSVESANIKGKIKSLFNLMLDYALEYELVDRNYSRSFNISEELVKDIQSVKNSHIAFTDDEIETLWKHVDKKHYVDVIHIQCYFGWRPQELCRLGVYNIDLRNWVFKGGMKTESGTDRIVPIHSKN